MKKVEKLWGSEEIIVNNNFYCGKILNLKKGFQGSIHYHKNKHETFYLLDGLVLLELQEGKEKIILKPKDSKVLPPNTKHRFTPLEDSTIIEFSTHHDDSDTYRDSQSREVNLEELKKTLNI